jgi:hypothetical protein
LPGFAVLFCAVFAFISFVLAAHCWGMMTFSLDGSV